MESYSSSSMFISEIPVRVQGEKSIKWIRDLNDRTTAQDVILACLTPSMEPKNYSLYIHTIDNRKIINDSAAIYKVVASFNQKQCARRLLFEIRLKKHLKKAKHVRFADEIVLQDIHDRHVSNEKATYGMIETLSVPIEKRLEKLRENFEKRIQQKQENYVKLSSVSCKRSSLRTINNNISKPILIQTATIKQISRSSSESGISSSSSNENLVLPSTTFETLV